MDNRKLFRVRELLIILPVLLLIIITLVLNFLSPKGEKVVIEKDGETVSVYNLASINDEVEEIIDGDIEVLIKIDSEGAWFYSSECKDHVCVNSGKIYKSGQSAVCLPARVSVRILGGSGIDGETY